MPHTPENTEYTEPLLSSQYDHRTVPLLMQKVFDAYRGRFDQVYIAYHLPFRLMIDGHTGRVAYDLPPKNCLPPELTDEVLSRFADQLGLAHSLQEKYNYQVVSVKTLMAESDCQTEQQLMRAIHTENSYDCFGKPTADDKRRNNLLSDYSWDNDISWPNMYSIPDYMQVGISKLFKFCGVERMYIACTYGGLNEISFPIGSLVDLLPWALHNGSGMGTTDFIYEESDTVFVAFDAFHCVSYFCGKGKVLEQFGIQNHFAGFWCDEETTGAWPWVEYQPPTKPFKFPEYNSIAPIEFDLLKELSEKLQETDKTRLFRHFPEETRKRVLSELGLSDERDLFLLSMFDDDHYGVMTYEEIIWKNGDALGRFSIETSWELDRVGGSGDYRYRDKWCYIDDGQIVVSDQRPLSIPEREQAIRHSSPFVFLKDFERNYHEFKIEAGATIQTISDSFYKQKQHLKALKAESDQT